MNATLIGVSADARTPAVPPAPVREAALRRWLEAQVPALDAIEVGERERLSGGMVSPRVERVEVLAVSGAGLRETRFVVAKRCGPAEATVVRLLTEVPEATAFPELIDAGIDMAGPWIVTPFYPGPTVSGELPPSVYASLAWLHVRYLGRTEALPTEIFRVDRAFVRDTLTGFAVNRIRKAQQAGPHPVHERALALLEELVDDERLYAGLDDFPQTLLHGDAFGLNVLAGDSVQPTPRLIDWDSARIGPAMLDVAMAAEFGSRGYAAYLQAWQEAAGHALDPWQAEAEHAWATAFNYAALCGAVALRLGNDRADAMVERARGGLDRFCELLDLRRS